MLSSTDILQSTALSRLAHCNLLRSTIPVCFQLTFSCLLFTGICLFPVIISHFLDSEKTTNTDVCGFCLTPRVGLEPTTTRLTAECSTIELSRIIFLQDTGILPYPQNRTLNYLSYPFVCSYSLHPFPCFAGIVYNHSFLQPMLFTTPLFLVKLSAY